uniref:Uncharacterized protein n=1 Tax=Triticum urartu TaxID=4572 RepID=A0A8R7QTG5_TRIUA
MDVSIASVAFCSNSHSMIELAFLGKLSQPPLIHGGSRHLLDVAFYEQSSHDGAPLSGHSVAPLALPDNNFYSTPSVPYYLSLI